MTSFPANIIWGLPHLEPEPDGHLVAHNNNDDGVISAICWGWGVLGALEGDKRQLVWWRHPLRIDASSRHHFN